MRKQQPRLITEGAAIADELWLAAKARRANMRSAARIFLRGAHSLNKYGRLTGFAKMEMRAFK